MMAYKAYIFCDTDIRSDIMSTSDPAQQKRLGQEVANYDSGLWDMHKVQVVLRGNYAKFTQNPEMCDQLLATGDKVRRSRVGTCVGMFSSVLAYFVVSTLLHRDSARSEGMSLVTLNITSNKAQCPLRGNRSPRRVHRVHARRCSPPSRSKNNQESTPLLPGKTSNSSGSDTEVTFTMRSDWVEGLTHIRR